MSDSLDRHELGVVGNIWVRQNRLKGVGAAMKGHKHHFDHVSMLTTGEVRVSVEGYEPKVFKAPTFIVIKKEHRHTFESLSEEAIWYCVFALRDEYGQVADMYSGDNSPYGTASNGYSPLAMAELDEATTHQD